MLIAAVFEPVSTEIDLYKVLFNFMDVKMTLNYFPVWLLNRLLSAGLEPVLSKTEKSCIASN